MALKTALKPYTINRAYIYKPPPTLFRGFTVYLISKVHAFNTALDKLKNNNKHYSRSGSEIYMAMVAQLNSLQRVLWSFKNRPFQNLLFSTFFLPSIGERAAT